MTTFDDTIELQLSFKVVIKHCHREIGSAWWSVKWAGASPALDALASLT